MVVYGSDRDISNFAVDDQPLTVNSCGLNTSLNDNRKRWDTFSVRRPQGRKDYQLLYTVMGKSEHFLNGQWRTVQAGQAVLYQPMEPQFYLYRANVPVCCKWVHFSGALAAETVEKSGLAAAAPCMTLGDSPEISALFDKIIRESQSKAPGYDLIVPALLQQLLALAGRQVAMIQDESKYKTRQKIIQAAEYMHYHYNQPQSMEQYAAQCGMSKYYFAHAFREYMGQSPHVYLSSLRLQRALELLSGTEMPIQEIARLCGYENPLYFSRAFSQHYHLSPSAYRKENAPVSPLP